MSIVFSFHSWEGIGWSGTNTAYWCSCAAGWVTITITRLTVEELRYRILEESKKNEQSTHRRDTSAHRP